MTRMPSKDSDQPGQPPSLISLCCPPVEILGPELPTECTAKTDQSVQMPKLRADLSLCWAHKILLVL